MRISTLLIEDVEVMVVRKGVKNINLAIYPPDGEIRVSAPQHFSDELISSVIVSRLPWIRSRRAALLVRPPHVSPMMVTGEKHMVFGREFLLQVTERPGHPKLVAMKDNELHLSVQPGTGTEKKIAVLYEWYREQLRTRIPDLLCHWQPIIGVQVEEWRIRRMKTRWGTCNISDKRIWLNLELARTSPECLEYVVVHELVHLLERYHNGRFWRFMDLFLPDWRNLRAELKQLFFP